MDSQSWGISWSPFHYHYCGLCSCACVKFCFCHLRVCEHNPSFIQIRLTCSERKAEKPHNDWQLSHLFIYLSIPAPLLIFHLYLHCKLKLVEYWACYIPQVKINFLLTKVLEAASCLGESWGCDEVSPSCFVLSNG